MTWGSIDEDGGLVRFKVLGQEDGPQYAVAVSVYFWGGVAFSVGQGPFWAL